MKRVLVLFFILLSPFYVYAETIGQDSAVISKTQEDKQETGVSKAIKEVVIKNMEAFEKEDVDTAMDTMHSQGPSYLMTRQQMQTAFEHYDLIYRLTYFKYIGQDGGYAAARVKQITEKVSGPMFQDNEVDMIQIFKKENGVWKYWTQSVLDVKYMPQLDQKEEGALGSLSNN